MEIPLDDLYSSVHFNRGGANRIPHLSDLVSRRGRGGCGEFMDGIVWPEYRLSILRRMALGMLNQVKGKKTIPNVKFQAAVDPNFRTIIMNKFLMR